MHQYTVVVTHACSLLGEAVLEKLSKSGFAADSVVLLDSESNAGKKLALGNTFVSVQSQQDFDFDSPAVVLLLETDTDLLERLQTSDVIILSHLLPDHEAPVHAPNPDASLNVSYTQQMLRLTSAELSCALSVLPALQQSLSIKRVQTVILKSAETLGRAGVDELAAQTVNLLSGREADVSIFPAQIAFNAIPQVSSQTFNQDLVTLLGAEDIESHCQTVYVPVFHGLVMALQLEFNNDVTTERCLEILKGLDNVVVADSLATPISDCNQSFSCVITQLEQTPERSHSIQFWMIADPMRNGLANNYVNVSDILLKSFL